MALSAAMTLALCLSPPEAAALSAPSYGELARLHSGRAHLRKTEAGSALPTAREAETIAMLDKVTNNNTPPPPSSWRHKNFL